MASSTSSSSSSSSSTMNKIERAHQMYREGRHEEALGLYSESLSIAKTKSQKIALHSNKAACFLKLHSFNKAAEECSSVLELDHNHTGALMLRAQTLVTLKEYQSALFDVNRLIELNPFSEVYQNLHARLKTQLSLAPIPESEIEVEDDDDDDDDEEKYGAEPEAEQVADEETNMVVAQLQASKGWQTIPKPKGHANLDYSRWDQVDDDSNEDDDDEKEDDSETTQPQFKFRVRTIGVRPVK